MSQKSKQAQMKPITTHLDPEVEHKKSVVSEQGEGGDIEPISVAAIKNIIGIIPFIQIGIIVFQELIISYQVCGKSVHIKSSAIGEQLYSDHASVTVDWQIEDQLQRTHVWRMDNYLVFNQEVKVYIQQEIKLFFSVHSSYGNKAIQWDAFKAYIRVAFIHQKAYE